MAKMARRPARPAPARRTEFTSAAPVDWATATEPDEDPEAWEEVRTCLLFVGLSVYVDLPAEPVGLTAPVPVAEAPAFIDA
jgi:hypothetical protein